MRQEQPYDALGRKVTRKCPLPECEGTLQADGCSGGRTLWRCDGLVDPQNVNAPLQAWEFGHVDGDTYRAPACA
jgi:hypothetical protein